VEPLALLFEAETEEQELPLPDALATPYGGPLALPSECLYSNFVTTVDGVVALGDPSVSSGPAISGRSEADRFVMGLLRAVAGAVMIGGGTLRDDPGHLWIPEYIFPDAASGYTELRARLGLALQPQLAVVTASGALDPTERALQLGALILTTEAGASRVAGRLPPACRVEVLGAESFAIEDAVAALRAAGHRRVLSEGGPRVLGQLLGAGLVDELFLTLSPVLAGRSPELKRLGLLEGLSYPAHALQRAELRSVRRHAGHLLLRYGLRPTLSSGVS
jgi:riboflavin biosynthesis pyrimidine reductase